jgi:hypothetical protein
MSLMLILFVVWMILRAICKVLGIKPYGEK